MRIGDEISDLLGAQLHVSTRPFVRAVASDHLNAWVAHKQLYRSDELLARQSIDLVHARPPAVGISTTMPCMERNVGRLGSCRAAMSTISRARQ